MKALSIVGLVLGILAVALFWWPVANIFFLVCGIVGIVLSAMGRSRAKAAGVSTGLATAGLVLTIIGTCLCGIFFFVCTTPVLCYASELEAAADVLEGYSNLY